MYREYIRMLYINERFLSVVDSPLQQQQQKQVKQKARKNDTIQRENGRATAPFKVKMYV